MVFYYFVMIILTAPEWGWLGLLPAGAALCMIAGWVLALRRPARRLLWLALPFAASELALLLAGLAPASLSSEQAGLVLMLFLLAIAAVSVVLVWRMRGYRFPAALMGLGAMGYALIAAFISGMTLSGDWI